jgi:hypothetical protein
LTTPKHPVPQPPKLLPVAVQDCIETANTQVCVPSNGSFKIIDTKPLMLNFEALKNYIKVLKTAPFWDKTTK